MTKELLAWRLEYSGQGKEASDTGVGRMERVAWKQIYYHT